MHPILFKIGPVTVYTYGTMIALGLATAFYLAASRAAKEGIARDTIIDLFFWLVISGFIGARLFYIFIEWNNFIKEPVKMLLANQGFVFYGGFVAALAAAALYAKRRKLQFWKTADIFAPPIAIAQSIGRIGCFFYGCCYGKDGIPIQLISSFALLVIFCILIVAEKYKKFHGQIFLLYALLYAIKRFAIEFFRADPRGHIWIFSTSQFIAIFAAMVAVIILARLKR